MNRFAVGDKAVIATDFFDTIGEVSPFRRGAVVEVTKRSQGSMYPYTVKPTDGTLTKMPVRESELAPYVEPTPKFQRGDKVRITVEATVRAENSTYLSFNSLDDGKWGGEVRKDGATIEKVEPPVETFGPGDYVRDPNTGQVFLLIKDGYVQVRPTVGRANPLDWPEGTESFTSEQYERVEYAQAPF